MMTHMEMVNMLNLYHRLSISSCQDLLGLSAAPSLIITIKEDYIQESLVLTLKSHTQMIFETGVVTICGSSY